MTEPSAAPTLECAAAHIPVPRPAADASPSPALEVMDWSQWSVVLFKPDCIARGLCEPILDHIGQMLTVVDHRHLTPTWEQISSHYDDMLEGPRTQTITWCDAAA